MILLPEAPRVGEAVSEPFSASGDLVTVAVAVHESQRSLPESSLVLQVQRRPVAGGDWEFVSACAWQGNATPLRAGAHPLAALGPVLRTSRHTRFNSPVGTGLIDWFDGHVLRVVVTTERALRYSVVLP